jgi:hypothetical protein
VDSPSPTDSFSGNSSAWDSSDEDSRLVREGGSLAFLFVSLTSCAHFCPGQADSTSTENNHSSKSGMMIRKGGSHPEFVVDSNENIWRLGGKILVATSYMFQNSRVDPPEKFLFNHHGADNTRSASHLWRWWFRTCCKTHKDYRELKRDPTFVHRRLVCISPGPNGSVLSWRVEKITAQTMAWFYLTSSHLDGSVVGASSAHSSPANGVSWVPRNAGGHSPGRYRS